MASNRDQLPLSCGIGELHGFCKGRRDRLFDEQVLARVKGGEPERMMHSSAAEQISRIDVVPAYCGCSVAAMAVESEAPSCFGRAVQPQIAYFDQLQPTFVT
jgi:hypothetical protein